MRTWSLHLNMEFHLIQMKLTRGYLSMVDPNTKVRVMCFSNRKNAEKCSKYLCEFRSKHGKWPCLDMRSSISKVTSQTLIKKRTPEDLLEFLDIVRMDQDDLNVAAFYNNMSFMYCHDFKVHDKEYNSIDITFRGQEIDGEADLKAYTELLETNYRVKSR